MNNILCFSLNFITTYYSIHIYFIWPGSSTVMIYIIFTTYRYRYLVRKNFMMNVRILRIRIPR